MRAAELGLSPREGDVLRLVGRDGLSYGETAKRLRISTHTVREYAISAHKKLNGGSRMSGLKPQAGLRVFWINQGD